MTQRVAGQIRSQIEQMRALARSPELFARNERVSRWSVAEHLDHLCKANASIVRKLADESAQPKRGHISVLGRMLLLVGWIPRGRGKAPEAAAGKPCTAAELETALESLSRALEGLPPGALLASRGSVVPNSTLGPLTPPQALRFVVVHTRHHLKIVRDILRSRV